MPYPTPKDTRYLTTHFLPDVPASITDAAVREYLEELRTTLIQKSVSVTAATGGGANWSDLSALWIAAGAMRGSIQFSPSSSCSVLQQIPLGTSGAPDLITLNFDPANQEYAEFSFVLPPAYNAETFTFKVYWSHHSTTTNFGVAWAMAAAAIGDGENIDRALASSEQVVTDTGGSQAYLYITAASSALTIINTPVAGDLCFFRIYRKPTHASDTLAIDARLHGVLLSFG